MSTKLYRSSGNETRETSPYTSPSATPSRPCNQWLPPASPLLRPPTSPPLAPSRSRGRATRRDATRLDGLAESPSPFLSLHSPHPTLNVLPDHHLAPCLFQSPVRWRYNDHRRMNHGPAETCIFMSAAHSLSLTLTPPTVLSK